MRFNPVRTVTLAATLFLGINASADIPDRDNTYEPFPLSFLVASPAFTLTSFTIVFQGNVVSQIDTNATQVDPGVNPYAYINQNLFQNTGATTSVTASLVGGNTDVTFTGSNPITQAYSTGVFPVNGLPHFGVNETSGATQSLTAINSFWTSSTNTTYSLPTLNVIAPPVQPGSNVKYAMYFANFTSGGNTVGEWFEVPYVGSSPPPVNFADTGSSNVTLSNVGFQLSPTLIPLDNLNFGDYPPPGAPGASGNQFTPLPSLDGINVSAGSSTPEPSFSVLLGAALFGLLALSRWRRSREAHRQSGETR